MRIKELITRKEWKKKMSKDSGEKLCMCWGRDHFIISRNILIAHPCCRSLLHCNRGKQEMGTFKCAEVLGAKDSDTAEDS